MRLIVLTYQFARLALISANHGREEAMGALSDQIPEDWYADAFDAASAEMAWTDRTGPEIDRVVKILQP
ncbi:MAG TPA: hypothetical protein VIJ21_12430, partial [Solirubrobacterales bacterium]